jgi:thiamine biosynthesis lipoprotein
MLTPDSDQIGYSRTTVLMDTFITIRLAQVSPGCAARVERVFDWFRQVEAACSRFDPQSEIMALTRTIGTPVPVSDNVYEAVAFALAVAAASNGAFDPTIGHTLERRGFNRNYVTGARIATAIAPATRPTYRDVRLDPARRTINLRQPLILDLGAVAKGLAIDLAARELAPCAKFAIDPGGDLFVAGKNPAGEPWQIGLRHPRQPDALLGTVRLSDAAICTSGDDARRAEHPAHGHHLIDPRTERSPEAVASATVIAPTALAADALSTAAAVLGPQRGLRFLKRQGVAGLLVTPSLERHATPDFEGYQG